MKVKKEDLISLGFIEQNKVQFILNWDYMFDLISNELFYIDDGDIEPELVSRIENLPHLQQVLESFDLPTLNINTECWDKKS
jgi:hypothetical protein